MATAQESKKSKNYKIIGTRPIRHDGADKVTGRAKYGVDYQSTGVLFGSVHNCVCVCVHEWVVAWMRGKLSREFSIV